MHLVGTETRAFPKRHPARTSEGWARHGWTLPVPHTIAQHQRHPQLWLPPSYDARRLSFALEPGYASPISADANGTRSTRSHGAPRGSPSHIRHSGHPLVKTAPASSKRTRLPSTSCPSSAAQMHISSRPRRWRGRVPGRRIDGQRHPPSARLRPQLHRRAFIPPSWSPAPPASLQPQRQYEVPAQRRTPVPHLAPLRIEIRGITSSSASSATPLVALRPYPADPRQRSHVIAHISRASAIGATPLVPRSTASGAFARAASLSEAAPTTARCTMTEGEE
ncbi:hypothetical protein FB451DRAFT_1405069 [Mycena latifolia]|nr:hypothetical protein FB451DRAFT_1405069 [Mycena latifolia]